MEKPRFQFGLKAVFVATTGAAVLMAVAVRFPKVIYFLVAAIALYVEVGIAFISCIIVLWLAIYIVRYLMMQLFHSLKRRPRFLGGFVPGRPKD